MDLAYMVFMLFVIKLKEVCSHEVTPKFNVRVDADYTVAALTGFWKSTGFCPPDPHQKAEKFLLHKDMAMNLALIGAVPHSGIEQVRIHWLLDLIKISALANGSAPIYDFHFLDLLLDKLRHLGLKPGFELMGNPGGYFTDFENRKQIFEFKDLVTALAKRYIARFGLDYVSSWNFESWNEPDHHDFDKLSMTLKGFLNYYDACSEGLLKANPRLKLGGPAASCRQTDFSRMCWALLAHCDNGTNYFTGERGVRLDFISFHHKGNGSSKNILDTEIETIREIRQKHPKFLYIPIFNDEADLMKGWSKPQWWRKDSTYAAMVVKVICQHQNKLLSKQWKKKINYKLLSNDNGFLGYFPHYFTQRTLLARFQMNNTKSKYSEFVRKPVYAVMGLVALLGEKQVKAQISRLDEAKEMKSNRLGGVAAVHVPDTIYGPDSWQLCILLYNSDDTKNSSGPVEIRFDLSGIPNQINEKDLRWMMYEVNNVKTNPAKVWENFGKPVYPTREQFRAIRSHEEPGASGPHSFSMLHNMTLSLPLPGVLLLHICARSDDSPGQVTDVTLYNVTWNEVLIVWSDSNVHTKCILTYEVEFAAAGSTYERINIRNTFFTSFLYSPVSSRTGICTDKEMVRGCYRVKAVDYWRRPGRTSLPICHL